MQPGAMSEQGDGGVKRDRDVRKQLGFSGEVASGDKDSLATAVPSAALSRHSNRRSEKIATSAGFKSVTSECTTPPARAARFKVTYLGNLLLDKRTTSVMLHWIVAEIRRDPNVNKPVVMLVGGPNMNLKVVSEKDSSDVLFEHGVHTITRFSRYQDDHKCFFYLQRNSTGVPFVIYAFSVDDADKVPDIFQGIRVATQSPRGGCVALHAGGGGNSSSYPMGVSDIIALGDSSAKHFKMRYQGRVFVGEKKASGQFIDDWLSHKEDEARRQLTAAAVAATVSCSDTAAATSADAAAAAAAAVAAAVSGGRRKRSSDLALFRASSVVSTDSGVLVDGTGSIASQRRSRHNSAESASPSWRRSDLYLDDLAAGCSGDDSLAEGLSSASVRGHVARAGDRLSKSLDRSSQGSMEHLSSVASSDGDVYDEILTNLPKEVDDEGGGDTMDFEMDSNLSALDEAAEAADRFANRRTTLIGNTDLHRTMLLQIGSDRIAFISLDKKTVILQKAFKEISYCTQGCKDADHFGFICRDGRSGKYVMYVFQCATDDVVSEIMSSLKKAFAAAHHRTDESTVCDYCPMQQLHRLCSELNGIRDAETMYNMIQNRIQNLTQSEYSQLMNKVKTEQCESFTEKNEVLMTKLRIMCELRQLDHVHVRPDVNGGSKPGATEKEFNLMGQARNQSKLEAFRNRAKKAFSLDRFSWKPTAKGHDGKGRSTSAADDDLHFLKDGADCSSPMPSPTMSSTASLYTMGTSPPDAGGVRRRSAPAETTAWGTNADARSARRLASFGSNSSTGKVARVDERQSGSDTEGGASGDEAVASSLGSSGSNVSLSAYTGRGRQSQDSGTAPRDHPTAQHALPSSTSSVPWRRNIYDTVVTPSKKVGNSSTEEQHHSPVKIPTRNLTSFEIRALWRSAIEQTRLLNRMEQENKNLKETEQRLLQMEYDEATPCSKEAARTWAQLLRDSSVTNGNGSNGGGQSTPPLTSPVTGDHVIRTDSCIAIRDAVREGVPRSRRGEIWQFLAQQRRPAADSAASANASDSGVPSLPVAYEAMLEEFTPDRHAILIDLGRTFPSHPYFRSQLGAGQLSLFNILKAYSLLDREVGYCQGLCFVAGILLMHTKEVEAFGLLKYLMFTLGIRRQYKPDMSAVQVQMYQLSRLLHDLHPDLHAHFEKYEITPSLYATPWFITLFSSQFPVGFVARVFDLLLLDGLDVVFKVSVVLLAVHKELLLQCRSFESITMYLKTDLPILTSQHVAKLFNEVCKMDVSKELLAYEAEYAAFEEDASQQQLQSTSFTTPSSSSDSPSEIHRLRVQNASLQNRARQADDKVAHLESVIEALQQSHAKLVDYVYAADVERVALRRTVSLLKNEVQPEVWSRVEADVASQPQPPAPSVGSDAPFIPLSPRIIVGSSSAASQGAA